MRVFVALGLVFFRTKPRNRDVKPQLNQSINQLPAFGSRCVVQGVAVRRRGAYRDVLSRGGARHPAGSARERRARLPSHRGTVLRRRPTSRRLQVGHSIHDARTHLQLHSTTRSAAPVCVLIVLRCRWQLCKAFNCRILYGHLCR